MPVVAGFLSAGAISIASGQVAPLLGIKGEGSEFLHYWRNVIAHIEDTKLWDSVLGFSCVAALLILRYVTKFGSLRGRTEVSRNEKIWRGVVRYLSLARNALIVFISTIIIASLIDENGDAPVAITGPVEEGFPDFGPPSFIVVYNNETLSFKEAFAELSSATIIPFLLILESIAIAKAFAKGKTIDATQEMLSLGLSNLLGSFFESFPVTGSFTRTAVNNASGVKTPVGGLYTGSMVLLCLAFLTRYLQYIPKATLAAVIICAVIFMVEIHEVTMSLWRSKSESVISQDIMLVTPDRSITYPAAEYVKEVIVKACATSEPGIVVIVDGHSIHNIDATAIKVLKSLLEALEAQHQPIFFWNWNRNLASIFVGFDKKNSEVFRHCDAIEQLLTMDSQADVEGIHEELLPPEPWPSHV
ncbi:hypothetical protein B566_EDAN002476 [Ephemera danica]|nr:hypothetical protein B566_EDAN002476 [Ephemera danica]